MKMLSNGKNDALSLITEQHFHFLLWFDYICKSVSILFFCYTWFDLASCNGWASFYVFLVDFVIPCHDLNFKDVYVIGQALISVKSQMHISCYYLVPLNKGLMMGFFSCLQKDDRTGRGFRDWGNWCQINPECTQLGISWQRKEV